MCTEMEILETLSLLLFIWLRYFHIKIMLNRVFMGSWNIGSDKFRPYHLTHKSGYWGFLTQKMISRLVRWLARNRRKVARHKKHDDQLNKTDTAGNGKITSQQMPKFFEAHEIFGKLGLVCQLREHPAKIWDIFANIYLVMSRIC